MIAWTLAVLAAVVVIVAALWRWLVRHQSVVFVALESTPGRFVVARVDDRTAGFSVHSSHDSLEAARDAAEAANRGRRVTYADIDAVTAASLQRGPLVEREPSRL